MPTGGLAHNLCREGRAANRRADPCPPPLSSTNTTMAAGTSPGSSTNTATAGTDRRVVVTYSTGPGFRYIRAEPADRCRQLPDES